MKKRIFSIVIVLCMVLTFVPTTVLAAGNVSYLDENGVSQTCTSATEVTSSDTGWTTGWYVVQGTVEIGSRVTVDGDVHLILADGCKLTVNGGIQVENPHTLIIYAQSTNESTMGKLSANAVDGHAGIGGGAGIGSGSGGGSGGTITINGGSIEAKGGDANDESCGILAGRELTINGGNIKAEGGNAKVHSCGILAGSELTITGGSVETKGSSAMMSCGIYVHNGDGGFGDMNISGKANVTAIGGTATATGDNEATASCGIYVHNQLTIEDSSVNAEGGKAEASYGITALDQLTIEDSTVNAEGGKAEDSCGITTKQLTMTNSTVKVKGGEAENNSCGISARNVSITGSTVKTEGGEAQNNSYGILVLETVTITGGSVEVKGGTAREHNSSGIVAFIGVTINAGSHVTVHTSGNGIDRHAMRDSPQLPAAYWWRTADTNPFTASGTAPYVHKYSDTYVEFTDSFTITLDPNFDGGESGTMTTGADGKLTEALPVLTRDGYTFDGWFTEATGGEKVTNETEFNGYVTIYAHWTAKSSGSGSSSGGVSTYTITQESTKNGTVTVAPKTASKGTTVTLTVEPDKGYTLETITVTDKNGDEIALTNKGDGKYTFKMPGSKVTVKATFMEDNSMLNFFVDVPTDAYYYDAVLWAAEKGITGGMDDTHFAPNATCTRAQIVTFLWRAAGSPVVNDPTNFTDVPADAYYAEAVRWAVSQGITKGTSETTFSPNATCTRAQAMAFLWRSQKSPTSNSVNPFTDVAADAYYANAVLWAVENEVTAGTSTVTFSPNNDCTRAQIVTFLFRCLGGK